MGRDQAFHLIGIAWLALAVFDKPHDLGALVYLVNAVLAFICGMRERG